MKLFAVRATEDHAPLGFFWSHNPVDIWHDVDVEVDPDGFEYKAINKPFALVVEPFRARWRMGERNKLHDSPDCDGWDEGAREDQEREAMATLEPHGDYEGTLLDYVDGSVTIKNWSKFRSTAEMNRICQCAAHAGSRKRAR